jgi:amino acid transporter
VFAAGGSAWGALGLWALGGFLCVAGAFCFAELASTYPRSGGEYVYLSRAFGDWAGFLFGWAQLLIVRTGASIVVFAYVFADYAAKLARLDPKGEGYTFAYVLLCICPVVVLGMINIIGVQAGKRTQNFLTVVKVAGLVAVLGAGFWLAAVGDAAERWNAVEGTIVAVGEDSLVVNVEGGPGKHLTQRPFLVGKDTDIGVNDDAEAKLAAGMQVRILTRPDDSYHAMRIRATTEQQPPSPWAALTLALIAVLWTYSGWNEGAYVATEVKDKRRNVPNALLLGTAAVIVLYLLVNAAYVSALGYDRACDAKEIAADVLGLALGNEGEAAMCMLVILSSLGAINGTFTTNARIFSEFGKDHALFASLGRWHPQLGTPVAALVVQIAICVATILGMAAASLKSDNFDDLIAGTAPVFWLFFLATGIALFLLRRQDVGIERPFTVPLYPLTPLVYCGCCGLMCVGSLLAAPIGGLVWTGIMLLGMPLYWLTRHTPRLAARGHDE